MINGIDSVAVTKLDVLSSFDEIKVCTGYKIDGKVIKTYPTDVDRLSQAVPVYESIPGWKMDISNCLSFNELPDKTKNYLNFISSKAGIKIDIISVGPKRKQTFYSSSS
jgi:adenylosuccinate synthase